MNRLVLVGLVSVAATAGPMASSGQIVRSSPATASSAQFDPFSNPAVNPYLNPWVAGTTQPTDPSTTLLYMMGARRYVQGQQEAIQRQQQQQQMQQQQQQQPLQSSRNPGDRSAEAIRKARGQATPGRLDAASSRYRFDSIRSRRGHQSDLPTDSRYGQTGSYYYR